MKKRVLVLTGGGDCPGLNAVIRAIVKRANQEEATAAYNFVSKDSYLIQTARGIGMSLGD